MKITKKAENLPMTANHSFTCPQTLHSFAQRKKGRTKKTNRRNDDDINAVIIHFIFCYNRNSVTIDSRQHNNINPFLTSLRNTMKRFSVLCSFYSLTVYKKETFPKHFSDNNNLTSSKTIISTLRSNQLEMKLHFPMFLSSTKKLVGSENHCEK